MSAKAGAARPLGINASIASPLRPKGAQVEQFEPDEAAAFKRLLRFQRQRGARDLLPDERVSKCIWVRVQPLVEGWKSRDTAKPRAHYRGVYTCGSVWMCPVCAAKISERRRVELQETIDAARAQGFHVVMVTFTLQHNRRDKFSDITNAILEAWRRVRSGKGWQIIKSNFDIRGMVTALEFTVSLDNGGHPHLHVLMFLKCGNLDAEQLRAQLSKRYDDALAKLSRYASAEHGVMVQVSDIHVGDYVSKYGRDEASTTWGLAQEMTKGMTKSGGLKGGEHYTPFQVLDVYLVGDGNGKRDRQAGKIFIEFAQAFKGKHQLGGLSRVRKMLGLTEAMSDEEIADANDQDSARFVSFTAEQWAKICRAGHRGLVLEVMSKADYQQFKAYMRQVGVYLE